MSGEATNPLANMIGTVVCVCCAGAAMAKRDKKGRPFIYCPMCSCRVFFHTPHAWHGYLAASDLVKAKVADHRAALMEKLGQAQRENNPEMVAAREQQTVVPPTVDHSPMAWAEVQGP